MNQASNYKQIIIDAIELVEAVRCLCGCSNHALPFEHSHFLCTRCRWLERVKNLGLDLD